MRTYNVRKYPYPGVYAERVEVAADAPLAPGFERMTEQEFEAWRSSQPPLPPLPVPVERWRVSKDTLITRVVASGRLAEVMAALAAQSAEDQFVWNQSAWFWSDNPRIRGLCAALGVDADALLAPDEFMQ